MIDARPDNNKRAYVYSVLFHAALLLLMLNTPVLFEVEAPKFFEVNLGALSSERVEQILNEAQRAEQMRSLRESGLEPGQRIDVPERKMIEIEEPSISVPREERITTQDLVREAQRQPIEVAAPEMRVPTSEGSIFTMDRKESFQGAKISVGEQPGAGIETGNIGRDLGFEIEGEITGRQLLSNSLPAYPEGLNKSAVIVIRIVVLPDGTVLSSGMVPVRKENAQLEELTMNNLKLWRFSALPEGQNDNQTGTVTFRFIVE